MKIRHEFSLICPKFTSWVIGSNISWNSNSTFLTSLHYFIFSVCCFWSIIPNVKEYRPTNLAVAHQRKTLEQRSDVASWKIIILVIVKNHHHPSSVLTLIILLHPDQCLLPGSGCRHLAGGEGTGSERLVAYADCWWHAQPFLSN